MQKIGFAWVAHVSPHLSYRSRSRKERPKVTSFTLSPRILRPLVKCLSAVKRVQPVVPDPNELTRSCQDPIKIQRR